MQEPILGQYSGFTTKCSPWSVFVEKEVALIFLSLYGPRPCTQFRAEDLHLWPSAIVRDGDMYYKF